MKRTSAEHNERGGTIIKKTPVIAVVGPTASGKSMVGIEICKHFNGEVISADSMQVYKKINIATAKLSTEEMQGIPHHMINLIEPDEAFNVFQYCTLAHACIKDIANRGKLPVIVGGTGMYINSLLNSTHFPESTIDENVRKTLKMKSQQQGGKILLEELRIIDPQTAAKLHQNDLGRIIRALELYYTTGIPASEHNRFSTRDEPIYSPVYIGLSFLNRQALYQSIDSRTDKMIEKGLLDEAKMLFNLYKTGTALQAIGIKEFFGYFEGKEELSICVEKIKQETRRYAKRQLTWFRRNGEIRWIYIDELNDQSAVIKTVFDLIENSGMLRG